MVVSERTTYQGTWEEISHLTIPGQARVELSILVNSSGNDTDQEQDEAPTLYERFHHLFGTVDGLPEDLAERAEEYLAQSDFGQTKSLRTFPE